LRFSAILEVYSYRNIIVIEEIMGPKMFRYPPRSPITRARRDMYGLNKLSGFI